MGNSQYNSADDKEKYITAKKIIEEVKHQGDGPLNDITNKLEQVFGISNIPVSHRAQPSHSPREQLASSIVKGRGRDRRDREYEERISNLESQLYYLRSVIEEMQERSKEDSPIESEVREREGGSDHRSEFREINESRSRVSLTYFRTRSEMPSVEQQNSRLSQPNQN